MTFVVSMFNATFEIATKFKNTTYNWSDKEAFELNHGRDENN